MKPAVNSISNRLSLRPPQRDSLEILDRVCEIISLEKGADPAQALSAIRSEFPTVTDFERDFPSLCFALATGVGKTRLMGAFISSPLSTPSATASASVHRSGTPWRFSIGSVRSFRLKRVPTRLKPSRQYDPNSREGL